ncbi:MAG: siphovirus Gp157 family protein, partial [Roseburia sp.]
TAMNNNADRIKKNLEKAMIATGKEKFKTTLYSFGIQNNTASVVIDDDASIPKEYRIPQPDKIDKKAIGDFLKAGNEVNFAHLEQSQSLRIR